ncbi:MAG TPA: hypothetical protein VFB74_30630 [Kribbellaceae bacterium]|nr:hypothetical protein [Kribbellaceae bacterium]
MTHDNWPGKPRRSCWRAAGALMARPPGTPDGCPKAAARFLAAIGVGHLAGHAFATWYDRHRKT